MTPPVCLIVARAANGVIGAEGGLPWHLPADLKHFKALTLGKPCIMGRKTWDSLPKKPLPGRSNIVLTRQADFAAEGALVAHTLAEALVLAARENPPEIMVIGGSHIFAAALPLAAKIYLTDVRAMPKGDAYFDALSPESWSEIAHEDHPAAGDVPAFAFTVWQRGGR